MKQEEYIKKLEEKIAAYEEILGQAIDGPYKIGTVVAGPENKLFSVDSGGGTVIMPVNPEFKGTLNIGNKVLMNEKLIIDILHDNLKTKEPPIEFDFVSWDQIGGIKSQMEKIRDAVESPFIYEDLYSHFGLKPSKGILLYGAPGCGKTLIAKAIASFLLRDQKISKDSFVYLKGGEMLNPYVGVTENNIKNVFDNARRNFQKTGQRSVIFIDEAEAILPRRGSRRSSDVEKTIVPTFLSEMDGFENSGTFIILATNFKEQLDPAVIRQGRIDQHIEISKPNMLDAEDIFRIHLSTTKIEGDIMEMAKASANYLFEKTNVENITGAMIAALVQSATSFAIKRLIYAKDNNLSTPKNVIFEDMQMAIDTL